MPERPVECSQCKKAAKITYKEIVDHKTTTTQMCADCPMLAKRLHGTPKSSAPNASEETDAGLYCGHCHTSLVAVKMGQPIGCSQCYAVFGDLLVQELIAENKLPKEMHDVRRNQPLHIGKTPDKPMNIPESSRLTALNEALNDALKKENYEEAASLRDQIKEIVENKDGEQQS